MLSYATVLLAVASYVVVSMSGINFLYGKKVRCYISQSDKHKNSINLLN